MQLLTYKVFAACISPERNMLLFYINFDWSWKAIWFVFVKPAFLHFYVSLLCRMSPNMCKLFFWGFFFM